MDKAIFIYLAVINVITFIAFGIDKRKAVKGRWRIQEKTLLLLGFMGGSIGQMAGMKLFRHKTSKWYFRVCCILFIVLHIAILFMYYTNWKYL